VNSGIHEAVDQVGFADVNFAFENEKEKAAYRAVIHRSHSKCRSTMCLLSKVREHNDATNTMSCGCEGLETVHFAPLMKVWWICGKTYIGFIMHSLE
jgi:hypothetical protein